MSDLKQIRERLCYTPLVYHRFNQKMKTSYSNAEIESLINQIIDTCSNDQLENIGKNYYLTNHSFNIRLTINAHTFRLITVNRI